MKKQLAAMKIKAGDLALDKELTTNAIKGLKEEMGHKVGELVKQTFSGIKTIDDPLYSQSEVSVNGMLDKMLAGPVDPSTISQEVGLKASLNDAVRQNKRLAQENTELKEEIQKLRAHHTACTSKPSKGSDVLSTRFGNIASNL
jgi:hypothetical protein